MREKNNKKTIWILSSVIIVLILIGLFFFVAKPQIATYDDNRRVEGVDFAVNSILSGIQQQGFTQLPVSNNQSIILAYVTPQELQFLNQIRQQQKQETNAQTNTPQ